MSSEMSPSVASSLSTINVVCLEKDLAGGATQNSMSQEKQPASIEVVPTDEKVEQNHQRKQLLYLATLCFCFFFEGWTDSSLGPLLPRFQSAFGINYAVVSFIFIFECVGFIGGAVINVYLTEKIGFGKTIVIGTALQTCAYVFIIPAKTFVMMVVGFTFYGFGGSLQNSQINAFVAGMNNPKKMGILHCCYGLGAFVSPFIATQFATMAHFSYFYFTALGIGLVILTLLISVFKFRTQNDVFNSCGLPPQVINVEKRNIYRQIWGVKVVHLLSFFILVYSGIEVTIGSWSVTYLLHRTGSGPSTGYVSSGFFGGLAAGRVVLLPVTRKIGEATAIFLYAFICIVLEILIWVLPRLIPSAIAIGFVGLFLGPMYPIIMNQCGHLLPGYLMSGAIGWIASFGVTGVALVPFITGALSDKYGVVALQPLLIILMCALVLVWAYVNFDYRRSMRLDATQAQVPDASA